MAEEGKRPKWPPKWIAEAGPRAIELGTEFGPRLERRLEAGVLPGLRADVDTFTGKRAATAGTPIVLVGATEAQNEAAKEGHAWVTAVREAVVRKGAKGAQRKDFGVGKRMSPNNVTEVVAGLDAVLNGIALHPEFARSAGILPEDGPKTATHRTTLIGKDTAQEGAKEKRKQPTRARDEAAVRIQSAIDAMIGAAALEFAGDGTTMERFHSLVFAKPKKKGGGKGGGGGGV